jgi:hypothetical protein
VRRNNKSSRGHRLGKLHRVARDGRFYGADGVASHCEPKLPALARHRAATGAAVQVAAPDDEAEAPLVRLPSTMHIRFGWAALPPS